MHSHHLVRVGAMGQLGHFATSDRALYARRSRVVVRTARGLEVGEVLAAVDEMPQTHAVGTILRRMTVEDQLLEARLLQHRDAAFTACSQRLAEMHTSVALLDVEHLFDGQTLVFYFLGDPPPEINELTSELAELYEAKVQFKSFVEMLEQGCGPGCGTEEATGGGCGTCTTGCAVASACSTGRSKRS